MCIKILFEELDLRLVIGIYQVDVLEKFSSRASYQRFYLSSSCEDMP